MKTLSDLTRYELALFGAIISGITLVGQGNEAFRIIWNAFASLRRGYLATHRLNRKYLVEIYIGRQEGRSIAYRKKVLWAFPREFPGAGLVLAENRVRKRKQDVNMNFLKC